VCDIYIFRTFISAVMDGFYVETLGSDTEELVGWNIGIGANTEVQNYRQIYI
jgi:hypothetical protein